MNRIDRNVGTLDAYLRLSGGLVLLALGGMRRFGRSGSLLAIAFGATKVAEGITRYCPMLDLMGMSTVRRGAAGDGQREIGEYGAYPNGSGSGDREGRVAVARTFPWDEAGAETPTQTGYSRKAKGGSESGVAENGRGQEQQQERWRGGRPARTRRREDEESRE